MDAQRKFKCYDCKHEWEMPYGTGKSGRQMVCPKCKSSNIHRIDSGGPGRGRFSGQGGGRS